MLHDEFLLRDEDMAIYRESLTSQASAMGFGTPLAHSTIFTLEQVVTHCKYLKATAAEVEVALWDLQNESVNPTISPWAFIPHEEKQLVFKFDW
jgi:hypothetical protein